MFLEVAGDGAFFGDVPWWVFPLAGIPLMLVMMVGMGLMMRMMMGMGGMMGMGSHGASHGPADAPPGPTSDQASEAEVASLRREVADLRRQGPLDIARERLARGDITKEEFDRIRGDLE